MTTTSSTSRWRNLFIIIVGLALLVSLWLAEVAVVAWVRAPKLVSKLQEAGALPLLPAELSPWQTCALVSVQDPEFYRHSGIGLFKGNLGHTTITQAISKRLFFEPFSPGLLRQRKIKLMVIAWAFDRRISKETQLRLFLKLAYFGTVDGHDIIGFRNAATIFFHKQLSELSEQQYLALIGTLSLPHTYDPVRKPEANAARVRDLSLVVQQSCPMPSN